MNSNERSRILIIDDEKMNIMALAQFLKLKYEVLVALNGSEGLDIAEKHLPDLILLDILMPDMDGFEVLKKLKESGAAKDIPVILITGLDSAKDEEKGIELGAADYIAKPFNRAIVEKRVDTHLKLAAYIRAEKQRD